MSNLWGVLYSAWLFCVAVMMIIAFYLMGLTFVLSAAYFAASLLGFVR